MIIGIHVGDEVQFMVNHGHRPEHFLISVHAEGGVTGQFQPITEEVGAAWEQVWSLSEHVDFVDGATFDFHFHFNGAGLRVHVKLYALTGTWMAVVDANGCKVALMLPEFRAGVRYERLGSEPEVVGLPRFEREDVVQP